MLEYAITIIAVAGAATWFIRRMIKTAKGEGGCSCGTGACATAVGDPGCGGGCGCCGSHGHSSEQKADAISGTERNG